MEISPETREFIRLHRTDDVRDLALHAGNTDGIDLPFALDQIDGWQRARIKLPEWADCNDIIYPPHLSMEQCSSQTTARYKADLAARLIDASTDTVADATALVDLTGGFGVDFSYMARSFDRAVYVERQAHLCDLAKHNTTALGLHHTEIVNADSAEYLHTQLSPTAPVTMIFIDPARRDAHGGRTVAIADCTPDVIALEPLLLARARYVMIKLSPMLDWRKAVHDLGGAGVVREVHIVSTGNECKELLIVLSGHRQTDTIRMHCVNDGEIIDYVIDASGEIVESSEITAPAEITSPAEIAASQTVWRYLYEPNASIMKAGCFALIERRYGIRQISQNSHLFVSTGPDPIPDFPGRTFAVDAVTGMGKRELRAALNGITHANIAVRNFPMTVAALRKKLKLKDGGETYLFATTDAERRHILLVTRKTEQKVARRIV
ncbi:class I SAM-dependent methyltransferase [Bifidobacterium simiarum]|uniref:SAM-dependent methyltransferase n=1 Tax=Bifidobacterium simiarum TaxID=2045441 RepID=A0A2M9HG85_9BIFI|nr:class I SAM-dependent methyltransferase [Bifidobacterium simiarum]PJM75835.1 SAM-dependent methyltransferase [Bifidobacterium simiarum]